MLGIYCRTSKEQDIENSTIIQQRVAGIKFAEQHNFEYELYEDEGKSGYKISDDDLDPFNNRPSFTNLINDIKKEKIDKVWVWEHSRLSRNQYASAFIFNVFEKYKITLYENQKQFDLNDPQLKFTRQILDAVSEYERQLIVARTTRGLRKRIDEGKRSHKELYCYQKDGKDENGITKWIPVESEINTYKYAFKRYLEGVSLRKICFEIHDMNKIEKGNLPTFANLLGHKLRKYQYTGWQLTIEGYEIYKQFRKNEIDNLQALLNRKYWVKSIPYPLELISIEDWVNICERLQIKGQKLKISKKARILRASSDIATGIIECGECGMRYYYHEQKAIMKSTGERIIYFSYFHFARFKNYLCNQKPKSFRVHHINEIFKLFYFFAKIVFDNKNEQVKESQRNIKQAQLKIKERMKKLEKEIPVIENRIDKFRTRLVNIADDLIDVLLRIIKESEIELEKQNIELSKLKIDYEIQNEKINQTEREMTYYDVKEQVNDWFLKLNVEEQRNELIKTIYVCKIFNHYIIIDTGKIVFLFDINDHHIFDMKLLDNLNKDEIYKLYFIDEKGIRKAKTYNDKRIPDIKLNDENRVLVFNYLIENFGFSYNLNDKTKFVSFVSLRGLYSQDE
jgi:DNA invertase Pin-like site-specific DNA recombinase